MTTMPDDDSAPVFVGVGPELQGAKLVPEHMRETVPMSRVRRWGKGRGYGDRSGWLVAELDDGTALWGRVSWQVAMRGVLAIVSDYPTPREPRVSWIDAAGLVP